MIINKKQWKQIKQLVSQDELQDIRDLALDPQSEKSKAIRNSPQFVRIMARIGHVFLNNKSLSSGKENNEI